MRDAALKAIIPIIEDIRSDNVYKRESAIKTLIGMLGLVLSIKDKMEIDDLATMMIEARHTNKIDNSYLDELMDLASGKAVAEGRNRVEIINNLLGRLLRATVGQWIESYGKPVITTTFTEEQVKLVGNHYDYTSGNRAARVLVKLTEYYDYLRRVGADKR
jgi:hypothetical protein